MKLRVKERVYELSIDTMLLKKHEFYDDATLALESAMDAIFEEEIRDGRWLTKPVPLLYPIANINYWRVRVMSSKGIVYEHTITICKHTVLSR